MRKINYIKRWDDTGTCYSQGVNITAKEFKKIQLKHLAEYKKNSADKDNKIDYHYKLYLGSPRYHRTGNIIFTNLTQRNFFAKILNFNLKNRNTCFIINNNI